MKFLQKVIFSAVIIILTLLNSCSSGVNIFTKQDDVQLGKEVSQEINNSPKEYPIYNNPTLKNYINRKIFQQVLASPDIKSKDIYPYQFEIIDNDSVFNAFALPGGYIYIYKGILEYLDSEAALAGVIGHEIAHAELRHATQRMTAQYGVSFLVSLVLGEKPTELEQIASNLFVGLAFLANSRADENQADEYSFKYLRSTRFYPGGVKFFFEHMKDDGLVSSQSDKIATFLSTHPDPIDRISNTNQRLQNAGYPIYNYKSTADGIFRNDYINNIKNKLK